MFYAVDYYQMGRLIPESDSVIALYRVSGIVPLALLIIPITISATDFVSNSEGKSDAKVLRAYVVGYWRLMVWLVPLLMLVVGLLTPFVLGLFGDYYASSPELMYVLLVGVTGGFFLRVPFGNLLSAVGRADINTYVNIAVLILSFFAFEYAIVCAGIWGLAVAMASMIWLSGLISLFFFYRYYKRLG
jgi:O-antigen/teichoic acid export membrane protein